MKKLALSLVVLTLISAIALADESKTEEIQQNVLNENSYLGINIMKQPAQGANKQQIVNKKSFLFINIILNGKVQEVEKAK